MAKFLYALLWLTLLGGFASFLLALFHRKMTLPKDNTKSRVFGLLPGTNCGNCGFAGCSGFADAVTSGQVRPVLCNYLTREGIEKIERICGLTLKEEDRLIAHVMCRGGKDAKDKYIYEGILDCRIAANLAGGTKFCPDGCTGLGNCEKVCAFGAIQIIDGVAVVDADKCHSCTLCADACPKGLIRMVPYSSAFGVQCTAKLKGADVLRSCLAGCIGCKKCEKVCPFGAITVENNCAEIRQDLCQGCGECAKVCPRGIIRPFFDKG